MKALLLLALGLLSSWTTSAAAQERAAVITQLDYRIIGQLPHSRYDFTQGLEIRNGVLYQGTGLVGRSRLQAFDLDTGALLRERELPRPYFGEGITVLNERIMQLSWRSRKGFIYRRADFSPLGEFPVPGEGWGLTNDGSQLIYSDGSDIVRFMEPDSWQITRELRVRRGSNRLQELNELEWTPDGLWANVWRRDVLVRIDPVSGQVTGEVNLKGLLPRNQRMGGTDVLNGVAYNPADGSFWVTGKNWPLLYQLQIFDPAKPPRSQ